MMLTASIVARLPLATFTLGVLVHVQGLTGSYARAGAAAGALAVAQGAVAPLLGRLVDRRGQTAVLLLAALVAGGALTATGLAPAGTPLPVLLVLAAVIGAATPPVGACLRTLIPVLVAGTERQRRAYAADATATELTWVAGPPLVLAAGAAAGSGVALAGAGAVLVAATAVFALSPASRAWRPAPRTGTARGSALASPAIRTLVAVLTGVGVIFGATEVGVTATAGSAAGLLLGLWGAGSLAGGVIATRLGGGAAAGRGFTLLVGLLGLGHLLLAGAAGHLVAFAAVTTLAGALIAPVLASAYAMVDEAAPAGTVTEAFAWLATATAVGSAAGAALGGVLADTAGPVTAFALAGAAGLVAAAVASGLRATPRPQPPTSPSAPPTAPAAPTRAVAPTTAAAHSCPASAMPATPVLSGTRTGAESGAVPVGLGGSR